MAGSQLLPHGPFWRCHDAARHCCARHQRAWKLFDVLFTHAVPPAQPDLFLAEEIAPLRNAPPDEAAN